MKNYQMNFDIRSSHYNLYSKFNFGKKCSLITLTLQEAHTVQQSLKNGS
jgi:hypothetical protein